MTASVSVEGQGMLTTPRQVLGRFPAKFLVTGGSAPAIFTDILEPDQPEKQSRLSHRSETFRRPQTYHHFERRELVPTVCRTQWVVGEGPTVKSVCMLRFGLKF